MSKHHRKRGKTVRRRKQMVIEKNREMFGELTCVLCKYSPLKEPSFGTHPIGFADPMRNHPKLRTIDHVIPLSKGGTNKEDNLQVVCRECNENKGNYYEEDYEEVSY